MPKRIKVQKLHLKAKIPSKANQFAACWDIYALEHVIITPNQPTVIHTGIALEIPVGYVLEIVSRSGLASKGCIVLNAPGKIDCDYRGEIKIIMAYIGESNYGIQAGERVAQCSLVKLENYIFTQADELTSTERGTGGLGSTGTL